MPKLIGTSLFHSNESEPNFASDDRDVLVGLPPVGLLLRQTADSLFRRFCVLLSGKQAHYYFFTDPNVNDLVGRIVGLFVASRFGVRDIGIAQDTRICESLTSIPRG